MYGTREENGVCRRDNLRMADRTIEAFLALVRAGLWEREVQLSPFGKIDWNDIYRLSGEQSVIGLVLAGLEHSDVKPPQPLLLQWIGEVQILEQQNNSMNSCIAELYDTLLKEEVFSVLVKGQGVAQCYERPLWRASGDIDLLLDNENYEKAKKVLYPLASRIDPEEKHKKDQSITINDFLIEIHGCMPFGMSKRADKIVELTLKDTLRNGGVDVWKNDKTDVLLPNPINHVTLVFTHFIHHLFIEGVGLRQICDWCRLLWSYKDSLNQGLLELRILKMGLMTEWKAFAALVVEYLGMPVEAMPLYDARFNVKGERALKRVLKSGNFGYNNDLSYRTRYTGVTYKIIATWRRFVDFTSLAPMFPVDAPKFFFTYMFNKAK